MKPIKILRKDLIAIKMLQIIFSRKLANN